MDLKEAFATMPLLQAASPAARAMLSARATLCRVARGRVLFREKEEVHTLYLLVEGLAALCKTSAQGERRVVFLCPPGTVLNELALSGLPASIQCETLGDSLVLSLPVDCVLGAMEQDLALTQAVMGSMGLKLRRTYHQLKNTSNTLRGDRRLAAKLWKLSRDFGVAHRGGTEIGLDLSITFLADMLGSKRETVSRHVKILTRAGLICFGQSRFWIPDREALKKYYLGP